MGKRISWTCFAGCTFADFDGDHAAGVSDGATISFIDTYFRKNHLAALYEGDDDTHLSVVLADVGFSGVGNTAVRLHLRCSIKVTLGVHDFLTGCTVQRIV